MIQHRDRYQSMVYVHETTLNTDFNKGKIKPIIKTVYKEKPGCLRVRPAPLKDLHSLTDWRVPNVPFNLFIKPHDIVHKNPWKIQEPYYKPLDLEREDVQKMRPRIIMTPFVSMDDFQGPEDRKRLTNDFYTSQSMRTTKKIKEVTPQSVRAPFPTGLPAPATPIYLPKLKEPYVSPEWRMDSVSWDFNNLRTSCDATEEFWLRHPLYKCRACVETATVRAHRKRTLMK